MEYSLARCTNLQVILQSSLLLPQGGSHVSEVLQRGVLEAEGNLIKETLGGAVGGRGGREG